MKLLDFSTLTGWPGSASTFKFIQEQMLQLQMLSFLGGTNYIVSGCANVGGTVGDGFVVINGEVLPFVGGAAQANVIIVDTPTDRSFFGGTLNPYYHDRMATFGTGLTQYPWSSFETNVPTNGLLTRMREAEASLTSLQNELDTTNSNVANKANISDVLELDNTTAFTPTAPYHPATKAYVDNSFNILAKGTTQASFIGFGGVTVLGDLPDTESPQVIQIGSVLPSANYKVFLTVVAANSDASAAKWYISNKTNSSFTINLAELDGGVQNVYFDWMIIAN